MLDLVLWVTTGVLAVAAGLLAGAGTRGRMPFRAEPLCRRCRAVVVFDGSRPIDRCEACQTTLGPDGLLYFRHRWIWTALFLALILLGIALILVPLTAILRHLLAENVPSPDWRAIPLGLGVYVGLPLLSGFLASRAILTAEDSSKPLCRECRAPLDAKAIFDAGACPSCKATFLDAGAPRPASRPAWAMRASFVGALAGTVAAIVALGIPALFA